MFLIDEYRRVMPGIDIHHRFQTQVIDSSKESNEEDTEFGMQSLLDYFEKNYTKDIRTIHQDIIVALDGFKGRNAYRDDITMLTCRVE